MLKLYPTPQSMQLKDGMYTFTAVSLAGDYPAKQVTDALAHYHITADSSAPANITYVKTEGMGNEAYILTVSETGVTITYSKDAGAMYAAQTLAQLIREKHVPCLSITDSPALENRMLSFDISRGKIPTMEHFKEIIDHLAAARYNTLILYWDSQVLRFAPFETYCVPDALTTAELDELKLYCNERNIKFSISVETFGHLANFLCYDEFKHLSNSLDPDHPNGDLNPLDPRSIEFVDMLIECVIPYCDTDFLQVHGDEIASLNTGKSKDAVAEKGVVAVYMEYMQKVCDLTWGKYHKIPIASSDMFIKAKHSDAENEAALDLFPKNAILDDWGYESEYEYHPFDRICTLVEKKKIPFVTVCSTGLYDQYIPRTYNLTLNAENCCRAAYRHGGNMVMQSTWGDTGNSQFMEMEYPGLYVFGTTSWNPMNFQLSTVLDYLDRYVYCSEHDSMARAICEISDAAWFSKGKVPDCHIYNFANKATFENGLLWNGRHDHAGIPQIYLWDVIDEYGSERALKHIEHCRERIASIPMGCKNGDIEREKILLNLTMFETVVKSCYLKLCVLRLKDEETEARLIPEVLEGWNIVLRDYKRLWLTENRESGHEIFLNFVQKKIMELETYVNRK